MRADKTLTRINELEAALWDEITSESTLCATSTVLSLTLIVSNS